MGKKGKDEQEKMQRTTAGVPPPRSWIRWGLLVVLVLLAVFWEPGPSGTQVDTYKVLRKLPHDTGAYCQGFLHADGFFYESTGRYGESTVRRVEVDSGQVQRRVPLSPQLFGEGLALVGDRLLQLTWQSGRGLIWNRTTLELIGEFTYAGEGWGLTYDGEHLILSDGTDELRFLDPTSFEEVRRVQVHDEQNEIHDLNELEYIDGEVWANIWKSNRIARIDPENGEVNRWLDLTGILGSYRVEEPADDVLNGIAWDAEAERLYVTGKYWPAVFEIEVVRR